MASIRPPYKKAPKLKLWQMTLRLALLAGFFVGGGICLVKIVKGIINLMNS